MSQPTPPSPRANRAAAGGAFIGSGTALIAVGLAALNSIPLAAAGGGILAVGFVFVVINRRKPS